MEAITTTTDLTAIKARQQATWASGDFGHIGVRLQIVGEALCEAVDLHAGERVLDVASGNGNASLAAARRFADVTSTDYVPALLEQGRRRAEADRLPMSFEVADAEALPFGDGSFDVALSTFGVMFAPDQERAAAELLRVVKPGGRIGLANWTPEGFIGELFEVVGSFVPPPAGLRPPMDWGTEPRLVELFGPAASDIRTERKLCMFRYASAEHWVDLFRSYYGPMHRAFAALDDSRQRARSSRRAGGVPRSGDRAIAGPPPELPRPRPREVRRRVDALPADPDRLPRRYRRQRRPRLQARALLPVLMESPARECRRFHAPSPGTSRRSPASARRRSSPR